MKKIDTALNLHYFGITLLWLGPAMMFLAGIGAARAWQIQSWPTATAQVLKSEVEVSQKAGGFSRKGRTAWADYFTARCTYQFEVNGQPFTETGICAEAFDREEVERARRQYLDGAEITIHYSPSRPQDSVLSTKADTVGLSMIFGFGVVAIPAGLALKRIARQMQPELPAENLPVRPVARRMSPPAPQDTVGRRKASKTQWLLRSIAVLVGSVLLLFGGLLVAACLGQLAQGDKAVAAAKVGVTVQIVATTIFGLLALCGAFLIWMGLKRRSPRHAAMPG